MLGENAAAKASRSNQRESLQSFKPSHVSVQKHESSEVSDLPIGIRRSYTGSSRTGRDNDPQFMSKISSVKVESIEFAKRHFNASGSHEFEEEEDADVDQDEGGG